MPRHDEFDDDYRPRGDHDDRDPRRRRSRGGSLVWLWVLLGVGGVFVVCGGVAVVGMFGVYSARRQAAEQAMAVEVRAEDARAVRGTERVYSRADFERTVLGKTQAEVRQTIGPPSVETANGAGTEWKYFSFTTDPFTGRVDSVAVVVFADGKAARVDYP